MMSESYEEAVLLPRQTIQSKPYTKFFIIFIILILVLVPIIIYLSKFIFGNRLHLEIQNKTVVKIENLEFCKPKDLVGVLKVDIINITIEELEEKLNYIGLKEGGLHKPEDCVYQSKVAIIVPLRNRELQLNNLLLQLHPVLHRQNIYYKIIVAEQNQGTHFNRAKLFNSAYFESLFMDEFDCFIFHDVDLLIENDLMIYKCYDAPTQLSSSISKYLYKLPYANNFGGVTSIKKKQFDHVNGFSNCYESWGGEDDDFYRRLITSGIETNRSNQDIGRYISNEIGHVSDHNDELRDKNWKRFEFTSTKYQRDGLNTMNIHLLDIKHYPLYTRILFNIEYDKYCNELYQEIQ